MSTRYEILETMHDQLAPQEPRYLGTILGCSLLWDDAAHNPVWPDGEPTEVQYRGESGIDVYELCDVNLLIRGVQPKVMDCGHAVRSGEPFVTWIDEARDECLNCAESRQ